MNKMQEFIKELDCINAVIEFQEFCEAHPKSVRDMTAEEFAEFNKVAARMCAYLNEGSSIH